jgi:hypothetical protein
MWLAVYILDRPPGYRAVLKWLKVVFYICVKCFSSDETHLIIVTVLNRTLFCRDYEMTLSKFLSSVCERI